MPRLRCVSAVVFVSSALGASTARASDLDCGIGMLVAGANSSIAFVGGVTSAIGTGVTLEELPPPVSWRTSSWVFGTLNLLVGTNMIAVAAGQCDVAGVGVVLALPSFILTAANYGLAASARSRADDYADAEAIAASGMAGATLAVRGSF